MRIRLVAPLILASVALIPLFTRPVAAQEKTYVGSKACAECHPEQYDNFMRHAKKATSAHSIKIMSSDLTEEEERGCYACHTTGYGQPGGFVSFEETPELGHAGCEVCHGPGSVHVEWGGDPDQIHGSLSIEDCEHCHNEERVGAFNFKPMLYGGAH
ncbi:cytochrome c family protein [Desulfobaculum sp. SPO524]|uniref:cytochrome c family protein n=1 Tax=Desulfobaculum sp. SPO524 TaxID=3378071 RepID=UPI003851D21E